MQLMQGGSTGIQFGKPTRGDTDHQHGYSRGYKGGCAMVLYRVNYFISRSALLIMLSMFALQAEAEALEEGKTYRLNKSVCDLESVNGDSTVFSAAKNSKFIVVDAGADADNYIVRFVTIYNNDNVTSTVRNDVEYRLSKDIDGVPVEKSVQLSLSGPVSGPLIIPFKYRLDDDSMSGEAAIGYYAGYRAEPRIPFTQQRIPISPFIGAGLTQIDVSTGPEADNRTGITLAVGILISNWADVNIGFVYGQDRVGDNSWKHEGESWVSFMIGWDI